MYVYKWGVALAVALMLGVMGALGGCGDATPKGVPKETTGAEEPTLNVYGWSGYLPQEILMEFTEETGIEVIYDVFENNESLEAKLLMGGEDYDVVFPSASPFLARHISADIYQPTDKARIPNYKSLDPKLLDMLGRVDPGNRHSIPFVWGTAGLGVNLELVKKNLGDMPLPDTWALLFDIAYAERLASCGIAITEVPMDAIATALLYLGLDPNSTDKATLDKAFKQLALIRPYIRNFQITRAPEDLLVGNLCLAQAWSGDMLIAQEKARDLCLSQGKSAEACAKAPIHYFVPREGGELWCDCMAIPRRAPHPGNAHRFINFLLRPAISARITEKLKFATGNKDAIPLLPPAIRDNPIIFPPPAIREKLYLQGMAPHDIERWRTRQWLKIKKGGAP